MNVNRIILTLLLSVCFCLWSGISLASEIGTILVSNLNVRSGPGKNYRSIFRLNSGAQVRILSHKGDWLKIEDHGRTGYIRNLKHFVRIMTSDETVIAANSKEKLKNLNQDAETIHEQLKASQTEIKAISRKERSVIKQFNASERALDKARKRVRVIKSAMEMLDQKMEQIKNEIGTLENQIRTNEDYAAQRLAALYKLNQMGRLQLLASAESFFDFVVRKSALKRILSQDEELLQSMHDTQATLESKLEQLNVRKAEKQALALSQKKQIQALTAEKKKRGILLDNIRNQKNLALAALQDLQQSAKALDRTMISIKPADQVSAAATTDTSIDNKPFNMHKGLLAWPVKGKIVSFFGPFRDEKYNVMNFQSGINIKAERGEPIRAVGDGYAIFSNWFKGFGNMIIIDHGDHYYTVYANLEEVFKVKGDRVEKGEVIATVGDSGSLWGPALHFEIRHHGKPIDPLQWINKG